MPTCPQCQQNYPDMFPRCPQCGLAPGGAGSPELSRRLIIVSMIEGVLFLPLVLGFIYLPATYRPYLIMGILAIAIGSGLAIVKMVLDARRR